MDTARLRQFLTIAEEGNYGRAAARLGISVQGLSKSIGVLETDLGSELFERGQFGARLTALGQALVQHAKLILAQEETARAELMSLREGLAGQVTVGSGGSLSADIMPRAVMMLAERRPGVRVHVVEGLWLSQLARLQAGEVDFLVMVVGDGDGGAGDALEFAPLISVPYGVVAGPAHPLAGGSPTLEELGAQNWMASRTDAGRRLLTRAFAGNGLPLPVPKVYTEDFLFARRMLTDGGLIAYTSLLLFAEELQQGRLRRIDVPALDSRLPVSVVRLRGRVLPAAAEVLIGLLTEIAASAVSGIEVS